MLCTKMAWCLVILFIGIPGTKSQGPWGKNHLGPAQCKESLQAINYQKLNIHQNPHSLLYCIKFTCLVFKFVLCGGVCFNLGQISVCNISVVKGLVNVEIDKEFWVFLNSFWKICMCYCWCYYVPFIINHSWGEINFWPQQNGKQEESSKVKSFIYM